MVSVCLNRFVIERGSAENGLQAFDKSHFKRHAEGI